MTLLARRRAVAGLVLAVLVGIAIALIAHSGGTPPDPTAGPPPPGTAPGQADDPFRYRPAQRATFEADAAAGLAHVLYAKSPGGAVATARRVDALRGLIEKAAGNGSVVDPDTLEGIVFLESGGDPNAQASTDLDGAVGLTQILAQTGSGLLGLHVDVAASTKLTRELRRGTHVAQRLAERRRVDQRFDPQQALDATVRYLRFAEGKLAGRRDLAVESYHMGVGNLQRVLDTYGSGDDVAYAQLYFDSTPLHHRATQQLLASFGDDSSTYYWRVLAAERIMRLYRTDRARLVQQADLQTQKASAENALRPQATTTVFGSPGDLRAAELRRDVEVLPSLTRFGIRIDPQMGELASKVGATKTLYRALRPEATALLAYLGKGVRAIAHTAPLTITSTARDTKYQAQLQLSDIEATDNYSLHTTGYAFDVARRYRTPAQAQAFQFLLDRFTALNLVAWVREPGAIHVTVGPRAAALLKR